MENCSTGSLELQQDNSSVSNSSDVVSAEITRLLYSDVGCKAEVCTRINPPGLIARQNLSGEKNRYHNLNRVHWEQVKYDSNKFNKMNESEFDGLP